jgi:hypothetical protein
MTTKPQAIDVLESRAEEQRKHLHSSVADLRGAMRRRLDVKANARQYMLPAAGLMAAVGLSLGYTVAGLFYPRNRR